MRGDNDRGCDAAGADGGFRGRGRLDRQVRVVNEAALGPIALTAADLAVAAPVLGVPRAIRLVRRFISGRIRCVTHLEVRPPA
jgi:hypothetical protein